VEVLKDGSVRLNGLEELRLWLENKPQGAKG
jgi:hypothetical protein